MPVPTHRVVGESLVFQSNHLEFLNFKSDCAAWNNVLPKGRSLELLLDYLFKTRIVSRQLSQTLFQYFRTILEVGEILHNVRCNLFNTLFPIGLEIFNQKLNFSFE